MAFSVHPREGGGETQLIDLLVSPFFKIITSTVQQKLRDSFMDFCTTTQKEKPKALFQYDVLIKDFNII